MSLTISSTASEGGGTCLAVEGEVDVSNASELRSALDAQLSSCAGKELVVDLARVSYIDSTGIGVLVGAAHRASEASARLVVARPQKNVARVLGLLGVSSDLNIREG